MSKFAVNVVKIDAIEPIPGADAIELARIADYRSVVRKGDYKAGDLAVYIPEGALVPEWLLKKMGLEGKLAGPNKNRVKAIKLRGCLSQGILLKVEVSNDTVIIPSEPHEGNYGGTIHKFGDNVAEVLGITKYEPPIPVHMAGEVANIGTEHTLHYDIENLKKYPLVFEHGEHVVVTEKLHGTYCCIGFVPTLKHPELFCDGSTFVYSKGLGSQGLVFKNNDKNTGNLYIKQLMAFDTHWTEKLEKASHDMNKSIYVMGEVFGPVQDLKYGLTKPEFRVFDIYVGKPGEGHYLNWSELELMVGALGLETVTVVYAGPYDRKVVDQLASGKTTFPGADNIREGVVIKPKKEKKHDEIGRVILKHISEAYLTRKGDTSELQ